jgi:uncharacterized protein YaaW (UPF0174 family)
MPKMFISNATLRELIEKATYEEKLSLTKILDKHQTKPFSATKLQKDICWEGGHGFANTYRGQGTGYLDILDEVADELKIRNIPSYNSKVKYYDEIESLKYDQEKTNILGIDYAEKVEEKIILKVLEITYKEMSEQDKLSFDAQINKIAKEFDSNITEKLTGTAGLMALGNLGGFATYTFLTTAMSTITMGTLGFGAYTAATTLLSIALGPVGWAGLGAATILALGKPDYQKLIPIVATIGAIRQRIKYESNVS